MTQNQLRYWELRWKQYYENLYIKVQQKNADTERFKAETERAKAQETARHNRAEERHEKQRIIQENIKLSQKSIELAQTWKRIENETTQVAQNWAKISQTERANMVHYAIEAFKADTERTKVQNQFLVDMGKLQVAEQETALAAMKASSENDREWFKSMVEMGQKAFGLKLEIPEDTPLIGGSKLNASPVGLVGGLLFGASQLVRRWLPNEYDQYQSNLKSIATTTLENYGPQAKDKIGDLVSKAYNMPETKEVDKVTATPSEVKVTGFSGTESPKISTNGTSIQKGSSGADYYSDHREAGSTKSPIETKTSSGTSVIYSGGSHYGPGY